jgi:hypothetical protein
VLRAGVLPRLRERRELLPVVFPTLTNEQTSGNAASVVLRGWQSDPLGGIKETVAVELYASARGDRALRSKFQDVVLKHEMQSLREFLATCHEVSGRRLMVILDQFEEYSLYYPDDEAFGEQFPKAIVSGDLSVSFLVSLREDALAKLDRFKGRIPALWDSYRRIEHLERAAAEDAIRLPVREYNRQQSGPEPIEIEDELVEAVLREVQTENVQFDGSGSGTLGAGSKSKGSIETPYLQLVMTRLWEREQADNGKTLRWTTLQQEGGAAEIVRTHLDRVMEHFSADERDVAARIFHRLVTPSGAKIAFSVTDLAKYEAIDPERLAPILRRLEEGSRRILRRVAARSDASAEPRYEIFHDQLGKAILSWRAKRLQEQEREKTQREEAEQKRLAEQTRASFREPIDAAMKDLSSDEQAAWARMMFYLISTDGRRFAQTAQDLAGLSKQTPETVEGILEHLLKAGILRVGYSSMSGSEQKRYEVAHDALASTLLEWHSQFVLSQSRAATVEAAPASEVGVSLTNDFPYRVMRELFLDGRVIPFLGAGVSLSARPQDSKSMAEKKPFLPSNRDLKEVLARECSFPASEFEASDIAEVASFYVYRWSRQDLDVLLERTLGRTDFTPSDTHRFVAETARSIPLVILTTNYDTLMEQALDEIGVHYDTLAYVPTKLGEFSFIPYGNSEHQLMSAKRPIPYDRKKGKTLLFRMHGPSMTNGRRTGSYVLTEEDQIEWLLRMGSGSGFPDYVGFELVENHLLSLGHSARDWSQRALHRNLNRASQKKREDVARSWAVALNPAPLSVITWQRYGVDVYNVELNEWAARMRAAGSLTA